MWIQEWEGYAQYQMNSGYWELCSSYYTVKRCRITSDITYLPNRTNPRAVPCAVLEIPTLQLGAWTEGSSVRSPEPPIFWF